MAGNSQQNRNKMAGRIARSISRMQNSQRTPFNLSLGAIVGIACGGGLLIFAILTFILIYYARRRHTRRRQRRPLDLDAGPSIQNPRNGADILEKEISRQSSITPLHRARSSEDTRESKRPTPQLPPPQRFPVVSVSDSWPLFSWNQQPTVPNLAPQAGGSTKSIAPVVYPPANQDWVQANIKRQKEIDTQRMGGNPGTVKRIKTSPRRASVRHSLTDNQLSSILRSTSQRLRDSNRRPSSRSSAHGPGQQQQYRLSTQPRHYCSQSQEQEVLAKIYAHRANSAKGRVPGMFNRSPDLGKMVARSAGSATGAGLTQQQDEASDDDSICGTPSDMLIPAALTSPPRDPRTEQERKMGVLSAENKISRIRAEDRTSEFGRLDLPTLHVAKIRNGDDPFISARGYPMRASSRSKPTLSTFDQSSTSRYSAGIPLQDISANASVRADIIINPPHIAPFDWFQESELILKTSPNPMKPSISRMRGHQRSKTIRLSGLPIRPRSVGVLEEESEEEPMPIADPAAILASLKTTVIPPSTQLALPRQDASHSPSSSSIYTDVPASSSRPVSIAAFSSFLGQALNSYASSPTLGHRASQNDNSESRFSSTSYLDYYTSPRTDSHIQPGSPARESRKARRSRQGKELEILEPNVFTFPSKVLPGLTEVSSPQPSPNLNRPPIQVPDSFINAKPVTSTMTYSSNKSNSPPGTRSKLKVQGPRSPPRALTRDSIAHSVGLLRRMNSTVSAGSVSVADDNSPSLPPLRSDSKSTKTRKVNRASRSYLSIGQDIRKSSSRCVELVQERDDDLPVRTLIADVNGSPSSRNRRVSGLTNSYTRDRSRSSTRDRRRVRGSGSATKNAIHQNRQQLRTSRVISSTDERDEYKSLAPVVDCSPGLENVSRGRMREKQGYEDNEMSSTGLKIQGLGPSFENSKGSLVCLAQSSNTFTLPPSPESPKALVIELDGQVKESEIGHQHREEHSSRWSDAMQKPASEMQVVRSQRESMMSMPRAVSVTPPPTWRAGWQDDKLDNLSHQNESAGLRSTLSKHNKNYETPTERKTDNKGEDRVENRKSSKDGSGDRNEDESSGERLRRGKSGRRGAPVLSRRAQELATHGSKRSRRSIRVDASGSPQQRSNVMNLGAHSHNSSIDLECKGNGNINDYTGALTGDGAKKWQSPLRSKEREGESYDRMADIRTSPDYFDEQGFLKSSPYQRVDDYGGGRELPSSRMRTGTGAHRMGGSMLSMNGLVGMENAI